MPPSKTAVKENVKPLELEQPKNNQPEVKSEDVQLSPEDAVAYRGWIKMTHEEHLIAQENEVLMGYDPIKGLGLVQVKGDK